MNLSESTQKKIVALIFISSCILVFILAYTRDKSLKNNFAVATGRIYEFGSSYKSPGQIFFKFKFSVHDVTYFGNTPMSCEKKNKIHFQSWTFGKEVQIVYYQKNPNNCRLLLTKQDYKAYGLSIPEYYKAQTELIDSICNHD